MFDRAGTAGTRVPAIFCGIYLVAAVVLAIWGFWLLAIVLAVLAVVFGVVILRGALATARRRLDEAEALVESPDDIPRIGKDRRAS